MDRTDDEDAGGGSLYVEDAGAKASNSMQTTTTGTAGIGAPGPVHYESLGCGTGGTYLPEILDHDAGADDGGFEDAPPISCDGPIVFADPALDRIVRVAISKPSGTILAADVAALTELSNEFSGVSEAVRSLDGIQCLRSLEMLDIGSGEITDVSPLESLDNLRMLLLGRNRGTDLAGIGKLTQLRGLFLVRNDLQDISPLANLDSLIELALENNRVRDITPLQGLDKLGMLWLIDNPIDCKLNAEALAAMQDRGVKVDGVACE